MGCAVDAYRAYIELVLPALLGILQTRAKSAEKRWKERKHSVSHDRVSSDHPSLTTGQGRSWKDIRDRTLKQLWTGCAIG